MAQRDAILDGLAWATLTEKARIARISAGLVRGLSRYVREHTKTRVKDAVKCTSPPFGRGKIICEAVEREYRRQAPIYQERQERHKAWQEYLEHMGKLTTRINNVYAFRFNRPPYQPTRRWDGYWNDWDARSEFEQTERDRDKGDDCVAFTHWKGCAVALVASTNDELHYPHIAVRHPDGRIVRTYLQPRRKDGYPTMTNAIGSLGGPKVKAALIKGKKVVIDWMGRQCFIHHDGQDHIAPCVETVSWSIGLLKDVPGSVIGLVPAIAHGDEAEEVEEVEEADEEEE